MTGPAPTKPLLWLEKAQWDHLRAIMVRADGLGATYDEWLSRFERDALKAHDEGRQVVKYAIDVAEFAAHCERRAVPVDTMALVYYIAERTLRDANRRAPGGVPDEDR